MDVRQAVLLVGGRATRMWPLTAETPKALLPVVGLEFVRFQLRLLAAVGVEEVFLTVGRDLLDEWRRFAAAPVDGVSLRLVVEDEPLDTAGGVRLALDDLDDRFFVLNGDVVMETDLSVLTESWPDAAEAVIALVEVDDTSAYGVVVTDADGMVERFVEKPPPDRAPARTVNAGMYLLSRAALEPFSEGPLSFEQDVFPGLAERGALAGRVVSGRWLDIGTPELYLDCHGALLRGESGLFEPGGTHVAEVGAVVDGTLGGEWAWAGSGARVEVGAVVEEAVLFPGASVAADAVVRRSVVGLHARIGPGAVIEGASVVGARAALGAGCELDAGIRIAPDTMIPERGVTFRPPT